MSNNSTNTYRWTPTGLNASSYDIYVRWVANAQFNPSAEYRIRHSGQFVSSVQDQTVNGGQWVHLGSHGFSGSGGEYIEVRALGGKTVADGVRLIEQTVAPPPYTVENLYYFHNDHLGTPQAITDNSQNLVWGADYEPFGQVNLSTNSIVNNLRFPGQYYDEETDQHYNYFRDYDPQTGRYVQSDPIGLTRIFSDPQVQVAIEMGLPLQSDRGGLNHLYSYAEQNPVNVIDPLGLTPKGKRPKITKDQCKLSCQDLQQALIRACQATGFLFFPCKAEVDQIIVDCIVNGGPQIPECKEEELCEDQ